MHLADNGVVILGICSNGWSAWSRSCLITSPATRVYWTLNNEQSLSSVWCLPQISHFFFSRNRNVQNLGQEQEQDLHYQRELKMKTTQTSILQFSERRQLKKIYKHLYCICSNDWAFLLICSFIDRLVNIITIKIAKWIVKILFILNI